MSIKGITVRAAFSGATSFEDEWIDQLYMSLESNVAIVNCDIGFDEFRGTMTATFGIECPAGIDPESFVPGVARDALDKAVRFANGDEVENPTQALPIVQSGRVAAFA